MKKFRAVCLAFVMMLSVAVMLCGCGDTKITDKVNFSDVDEITVVMSDESTAVLGEVDFKTVKNILQSAETGGTSGEFDGGILIETRKDGIVTHNIRVGKVLPFTAMTLTRAVKQLEATDLFLVAKDGVNKFIETKYKRDEFNQKIHLAFCLKIKLFAG